jgi:hypothetical protein
VPAAPNIETGNIVAKQAYPATNLTTGNCSGLTLTDAEGNWSASGVCSRVDGDGDGYSMSWRQDYTMDAGVWEMVGGTGKWDGVSGGGTYVYTPLAGGAGASTYSGNLTLK